MKLFCAAILGTVLVASAADLANINGTWTAVFTGPIADRPKMVSEMTFDLVATGDKLTGMAHMGAWPGDAPLVGGRIEGDRISFTVIGKSPWSSRGPMGERSAGLPKLTFTGRIKGEEMQLTLEWDSVILYGPPSPEGASQLAMKATKVRAVSQRASEPRLP